MTICSTLPDIEAKPEGLHVCVSDHEGPHTCISCGLLWDDGEDC
jgi:hypothetical protein